MRSEEEVTQKFYEGYNKALKSRREEYLSVCYLNCKNNARHRLQKHGMVGFCNNPQVTVKERTGVAFCNDDDTARSCPFFECRHTEESVREELEDIMRSPGRCGQDYPKLAILLWFLQRDNLKSSRLVRAAACLADVTRSLWSFISLRWW